MKISELEQEICKYNKEYKSEFSKMNTTFAKDPIMKHKIREKLNVLSDKIHGCSEKLVELKEEEQTIQ